MRKLQIEREKERFAAIRQDAAKLLEVATELKQYVDKTGKDVLSSGSAAEGRGDGKAGAADQEQYARGIKDETSTEKSRATGYRSLN
jgi:hypothetical protein